MPARKHFLQSTMVSAAVSKLGKCPSFEQNQTVCYCENVLKGIIARHLPYFRQLGQRHHFPATVKSALSRRAVVCRTGKVSTE